MNQCPDSDRLMEFFRPDMRIDRETAAHVAECEECAAFLDVLSTMKAAAVPERGISAESVDRIMEAVGEEGAALAGIRSAARAVAGMLLTFGMATVTVAGAVVLSSGARQPLLLILYSCSIGAIVAVLEPVYPAGDDTGAQAL